MFFVPLRHPLRQKEKSCIVERHNGGDNKFFQITRGLPMELQMMLCHRVFGAEKDIVLTKHSEPAFKKLGRLQAMSSTK